MKYYFEDQEKQKQLKVVLDEWLDTPFRHHCGVKGLGTDCIQFVARVFEEMGILTWKKNLFPNYAYDIHLHKATGLLTEGIEKNFNVEKCNLKSPMNGDIILFHIGHDEAHVAIYFDGYIYQSLTSIGVCKIIFTDRIFNKKMVFLYRILN